MFLLVLVTIFLNLTLAYTVYHKSDITISKSIRNSYALLNAFIALWSLFNYIGNYNYNEIIISTLTAVKIVMIITTLLGLIFFRFTIVFPIKLKLPTINIIFKILKYWSLILIILILSNQIFTGATTNKYGQISLESNWGLIFYTITLLFEISLGFFMLIKKLTLLKGRSKAQLRIFIIGAVAAFSLQIITNLLLILFFNNTNLTAIGPSFSLILVATGFYSIVKYHFFNIKIAIKNILAIIISYTIAIIPFLIKTALSPMIVIRAIISITIFIFTYKKLNLLLQHYYLSELDKRKHIIENLFSQIEQFFIEEDANKIVTRIFKRHFNAQEVKINFNTSYITKLISSSTVKRLQKENIYIIMSGHSQKFLPPMYITSQLLKTKLDLIILLHNKNNIFGYIGVRFNSPDIYLDTEDIADLNELAKNLSITLYVTYLYQQVNSFNETLQKEVKLATSKLQKQLDKMKEMRRKEQDMMDIMGHELRTPLSVVKNAIDLLKMTHSAGTLNDEVFNKYINMADDNAKREIRLLETMLAATKFDKKKMQFNLTKVDFIELANTSLLAFTKKAKEKGLQLTFKKPKQKHLYILADRDKAQEIIDNLVDNAIKYTEKGSVTITLKEEGKYIKLSVKDTGVGIAKKDIKKLGRKFFRAQQYLNDDDKKAPSIVRPGGTGLGLYVVFSLIKGMKGKYKVESELGKGSNFMVWLPKFKEK